MAVNITPPMSPAVRATLYAVYAWFCLVLLLVNAGFIAAGNAIPTVVTVALAVVPLAGTALGFLAKANVPAGEPAGDGGPV